MRYAAFERAVEPFHSAFSSFRPSIRHSGEGRNPEGWGEGVVALRLVPSLGRSARSLTLHHPASHHFRPHMQPLQGHVDSSIVIARTDAGFRAGAHLKGLSTSPG